MNYPSMRDPETGEKPPYGSLEHWFRFIAVYGSDRHIRPNVRATTIERAATMEAVARTRREFPHLTATGRARRP